MTRIAAIACTLTITLAVLIGGCASTASAPDYANIVASPDRSEADRATDARRSPLKLLEFSGARPGMKVLDMGTGGGYNAELLARAVGPAGIVYAQNDAQTFEKMKPRFDERTKNPALKNLVQIARPFED